MDGNLIDELLDFPLMAVDHDPVPGVPILHQRAAEHPCPPSRLSQKPSVGTGRPATSTPRRLRQGPPARPPTSPPPLPLLSYDLPRPGLIADSGYRGRRSATRETRTSPQNSPPITPRNPLCAAAVTLDPRPDRSTRGLPLGRRLNRIPILPLASSPLGLHAAGVRVPCGPPLVRPTIRLVELLIAAAVLRGLRCHRLNLPLPLPQPPSRTIAITPPPAPIPPLVGRPSRPLRPQRDQSGPVLTPAAPRTYLPARGADCFSSPPPAWGLRCSRRRW